MLYDAALIFGVGSTTALSFTHGFARGFTFGGGTVVRGFTLDDGLLQLIGAALQIVDVDLSGGQSPALVGFVVVVTQLPGPGGDGGEESVAPSLTSVLLLLLLLLLRCSVTRAR